MRGNFTNTLLKPLFASSVFLASVFPAYSEEIRNEKSIEGILEIVEHLRENVAPSYKKPYPDKDGSIIGTVYMWNGMSGNAEVTAIYGLGEEDPTVVLYNRVDPENIDTNNGDVYLLKGKDGYRKEEYIGGRSI